MANLFFSQHAKLNMAGFVLYLRGDFALRYRMVGLRQKVKKLGALEKAAVSDQRKPTPRPKPKASTTEDTNELRGKPYH
ncbi:MAG TPA: hypothetical protein VGJ30_02830 [Candidatus Angelobacter sp.]